MLKAKLLAICVCPAVLAPPTILAVHRPARHAVAHLLQRAAHHLDDRIPAKLPIISPPILYANMPCLTTLADLGRGGNLAAIEGVELARHLPDDKSVSGNPAPLSKYSGGGYFGGSGDGTAGGAPSGPVFTSSTTFPLAGGIGVITPSFGPTTGTVPEPGTWALLVTGFGVIGAHLRYKRVLTA